METFLTIFALLYFGLKVLFKELDYRSTRHRRHRNLHDNLVAYWEGVPGHLTELVVKDVETGKLVAHFNWLQYGVAAGLNPFELQGAYSRAWAGYIEKQIVVVEKQIQDDVWKHLTNKERKQGAY